MKLFGFGLGARGGDVIQTYFLSGATAAQGFCSILAILVEGIIKRSSVKLIILNVDQWSRRCHFKDLSTALEALMLSKAEQFVQF